VDGEMSGWLWMYRTGESWWNNRRLHDHLMDSTRLRAQHGQLGLCTTWQLLQHIDHTLSVVVARIYVYIRILQI